MKTNTKRPMIITFIVVFLVFILFTLGIFSYVRSLQNMFKTESKESMGELTSQSVVSLQTHINKNLVAIRGLAKSISMSSNKNTDEIVNLLKEYDFGEYFIKAGFLLPDGTTYTSKDEVTVIPHMDLFEATFSGSDSVSDPFVDESTGNTVTIYSSPVYSGNEIVGIIYANYDVALYEQALNFSWFDGEANNFIATDRGVILAASRVAKAYGVVMKNIKDVSSNPSDSEADNIQDMYDVMTAHSSGFTEFVFSNNPCYVCYLPIGINDWYLISTLPVSVVENRTASMMLYSVIVCTAVILLFLVGLMLFIRILTTSQSNLERLAYIDEITNKKNYNWFLMKARKMLSDNKNTKYALVVFDVDKFKYINEMYGFESGDKTLCAISDVLENFIRENELSARMQSDSFVMLLECRGVESLSVRFSELFEKLRPVGETGGNHYDLIVAMGVYEIVDKELDIQAIVDRAIIAKKTAKGMHQSTFAFYDEKIINDVVKEKNMENEMNTALAEGQFEVHYQPKYYIDSLELSGAEALVRWNHPERGLVPPGEFISLFEKNGFIVEVDLYVFTQVCKQIRDWLDRGIKAVPVSVNLSRKHLGNPNFLAAFENAMNNYNIPHDLIEFEITESIVYENETVLLKLMERIHTIGCQLSMDDFGTGYSSLNMLKNIPVDVLKLDRAFLNNAAGNDRGKEIIASVVLLAKKLKISVVAEGVEDGEQLEFLKSIDCDVAQGYYLSRPIKVGEFEQILLNPVISLK